MPSSPRVQDADVQGLLAPYADDVSMTQYIGQAHMLVDEELGASGLSEDRLKYIELNLAAHFAALAVERGGFTYQKIGNSEEGYATDRTQVRFSSTRFGQSAVAMDSTGNLQRMDNPKGTAEFRVVSAKDDRCYDYGR